MHEEWNAPNCVNNGAQDKHKYSLMEANASYYISILQIIKRTYSGHAQPSGYPASFTLCAWLDNVGWRGNKSGGKTTQYQHLDCLLSTVLSQQQFKTSQTQQVTCTNTKADISRCHHTSKHRNAVAVEMWTQSHLLWPLTHIPVMWDVIHPQVSQLLASQLYDFARKSKSKLFDEEHQRLTLILTLFMFMHLADTFIQSNLQFCLRTPTGVILPLHYPVPLSNSS